MFPSDHKTSKSEITTPDLEDDDDGSILDDVDVEVDVDAVAAQKPHFLDYDDAVPPPDFEESFDRALSFGMCDIKTTKVTATAKNLMQQNATDKTTTTTDVKAQMSNSGEQLKMDKKYEVDGEISDYELAASGYTKKEFTQDDNTLHFSSGNASLRKTTYRKPKHFLDENPIPPDYMLDENELREHRSLDRNFERQSEQQQQQHNSRTDSAASLTGSAGGGGGGAASVGGVGIGSSGSGVRKSSLDRGSSSSSRSSRERYKEPSYPYTLSRFLDSDAQLVGSGIGSSSPCLSLQQHRMSKGSAWTDSFDSRYSGGLQVPLLLPSSDMTSSSTTNVMVGGDHLDTLGPKVECVYSLLSMLGSNDPVEMSKKFLELSRTPETCTTLRRSGCIPLLVQMMYSVDGEESVRKCASMALHNVVHSHPDEKAGRREAKVLRLLDQIMDYCNFLKTLLQSGGEAIADDSDRHPLAAISSLMKVSFDEEHRHAMCELGALQAIPSLVHLDHAAHGPKPEDQCCNSLRRYALMALTNLTFGDENNKALLCSQKFFMEALVAQLDSAPDDLLQVTASVLRNLSWRADSNMKAVLNEIGTVTALAKAAMKNKSENTLKAILSALWNLSAHCSTNKAEFCAVDGALAFLVDMLTYEGPSKTLKIIENAGGILRNVSSHIAVREHYRSILRKRNCLSILLQQLKSESLTVVSNSCGTLWNLSARCPEDQKFLWDNGAVPMLRSLIHSKHAMISEGSSSALKNLLNFRPSLQNQTQLDPIARSMGLKKLPTLNARKQKALEQELGEKEHAETCDNLDMGNCLPKERSHFDTTSSSSSMRRYPLAANGGAIAAGVVATAPLTRSAMLTKSESRDSVFSVKSDSVYENLMRSHSASDANRKAQKLPYAANPAIPAGHAFASLENGVDDDVEPSEEQPIDYAAKYNEQSAKNVEQTNKIVGSNKAAAKQNVPIDNAADYAATYQETDLDQPTDFSLRYAENQIESDIDISPQEAEVAAVKSTLVDTTKHVKKVRNDSNEILLILEDSVKCYQTEDTPYVISNAASVTDLRQTKIDNTALEHQMKATVSTTTTTTVTSRKYQRQQQPAHQATSSATVYGSGTYTPEKPIYYCEEGTPGYFSRYESLSSLEESPPQQQQANTSSTITIENKEHSVTDEEAKISDSLSNEKQHSSLAASSEQITSVHHAERQKAASPITIPGDMPQLGGGGSAATNVNSAQETPLMFSRHSSMDSLVEEDIGPCDDKSSVVSDFSRLASGVISPSEIPDSPTQSMPQSPRRNSASAATGFSSGVSPATPRSGIGMGLRGNNEARRPLRSVFEDDLNTFHVENTPAQFSSATSLSNLSFVDDDNNISPAIDNEQEPASNAIISTSTIENITIMQANAVSEGEEEECGTNNDDMLLASCINMGMNRTLSCTFTNTKTVDNSNNETTQLPPTDEPKQYFTEDTPALLSKVGSNTNLSAISICSSINELKDDTLCELNKTTITATTNNANRHSLNLSDDVSSNASESGAAMGQSMDILQQCIRDGMKKPSSNITIAAPITTAAVATIKTVACDPIAMMRRGGGNILPPYLTVSDEMSKYIVENSPCSFSVMSGLSNLTVGSSLVGPAVHLKGNGASENAATAGEKDVSHEAKSEQLQQKQQEGVRREQHWHDDSLSSLSIDSEDDTNLLSQAIAAGCNRPKSNLGFSTTTTTTTAITNKRSTSLSASQPIPINSATSASSLNSTATSRNYQRHHHHHQQQAKHKRNNNLSSSTNNNSNNNGNNDNESFSSVDSSDSNDNQSKSLFELCILTGMHKSRETQNNRRKPHQQHQLLGRSGDATTSTQSNPNLKQQFDSLPTNLPPLQSSTSSSHLKLHHSHHHSSNRHLRERERKDEKLLMECINTGISKKIGSGSGHAIANDNASAAVALNATTVGSMKQQRDALGEIVNVTLPKNVQATSAVALEQLHQMEVTSLLNVSNIAATPDVERNNETISNDKNGGIANEEEWAQARSEKNISPDDAIITNAQRNRQQQHRNTTATSMDDDDPQSPEIVRETMKDIGFREFENIENLLSNSISLDNTTSDESNESFIMETTVSLERSATERASTIITADKHKDPDLMLKSVERLTLEFVSSAEQLRTHGSNSDSNEGNKQLKHTIFVATNDSVACDSISNSNNTWNENTCPNDISFPSISLSAPVVASSFHDDNDDDYDEEQATEADHKEICDFAEITPTNEEQPQPSLGLIYDEEEENDINFMYANTTQPNSLDRTETDTIINDETSYGDYMSAKKDFSSSTSSGINFQLGGEVQTAAARTFFNSSAMTNSTIIAIEARALADTLEQNDIEENTDLTFSMNSLDLDNVRPPSGMESLNISGYYQEMSATPSLGQQPSSLPRTFYLPQSPQFNRNSPKFPRKQLPSGLVARRALGQLPVQLASSAESVNSSYNLLDNIKPPSLMDELLDSMISVASIQSEVAGEGGDISLATTISLSNYETAAVGTGAASDVGVSGYCNNDFDDNTVTLQSCFDTMPHDDDNSNDSGTPLPSDVDFSSAESTPKKLEQGYEHGVRRTLTPKQKRKFAKDRFKTYTIAADMVLSEEQLRRLNEAEPDELLQIEIVTTAVPNSEQEVNVANVEALNRSRSASRRRTSQERYKTQTIECPAHVLNATTTNSTDDLSSSSFNDSEEISSIRAMTKQFKFITAPCAEANTRQELDYNSIEGEQNSETESCNGDHINGKAAELDEHFTIAGDNAEQETGAEANLTGPRITKPAEDQQAIINDTEQAKIIRGRKKPAYVSPYSRQYQRNTAAATVSRLATNKLITPVNAAGVQARKSNTAMTSPKAGERKKNNNGASPVKNANPPSPPAQLERQGTFVQDEPTIIATHHVPEVTETPTVKTPVTSPLKRTSKLPTKQRQISTTTTTTTRKILTTKTTTATRRSLAISNATKTTTPQRSNSNATMQVTASAARIAVLAKRVSTTTPPSRSNSNLTSTNAATTRMQAAGAGAAKISQAQSRIASIWKRVDEVKVKQQQKQIKTAATSSSSNLKTQQTQSSMAINAEQQEQQKQLIRSSTFDNTPTKTTRTTTTKPLTAANSALKMIPATNTTTKTTTKLIPTVTATTTTVTKSGGNAGSKIAVNRNILSLSPRRDVRK